MRQILCLALLVASIAAAVPQTILVTVPPQLEAVQAIAGPDATVLPLVPVGSVPENYTITPQQLTKCAKATLFITIGAPIETKVLPKLKKQRPDLQMLDGTHGMKFRTMSEEHHHGQKDGHHDKKGQSHADPHTWLSIANMKCFAENTARALSQLYPQEKEEIDRRTKNYTKQLDALADTMAKQLLPLKGSIFLVNHPAFGYLADEYGLTQVSIEKEGKTPGARHLADLTQLLEENQLKTLFVQPQFNRHTCQMLAYKHQLSIVVLDPLPARYSDGMLDMAQKLVEAWNEARGKSTGRSAPKAVYVSP